MNVTNVANGTKKAVHYHNKTPYIMTGLEKCPYYILDQIVTDYYENYEYSYWRIEDYIYTGYYTNTLDAIQKQNKPEQLKLF